MFIRWTSRLAGDGLCRGAVMRLPAPVSLNTYPLKEAVYDSVPT